MTQDILKLVAGLLFVGLPTVLLLLGLNPL
jgi:hypothetical protein